jgi:hypothetical protein
MSPNPPLPTSHESPHFVVAEAQSTDDDYLSRLVDMGDAPTAAYGDWQYLTADESEAFEESIEPVGIGTITGLWFLSAADPARVNWQKNKWWGPDDAHLH